MNIFFLSFNPEECAIYHCDKHVVKMILETAQLLYTCLWTTFKNSEFIKDAPLTKNGQKGYKKSHVNHPCAKWLRQSTKNYEWLCKLGIELCKEYTYRYERVHSTQQHIEWLSRITPNIDDNGFTIPLLAMPNEYKCDNVIKSYKTYYIKDKKRFAKWTKRNIPKWFIELDDL